MIYQHLNKRTAMLSLATSYIAHYCNQLIHVALPISMPRYKSITVFFIKIALKLSYICKKNAKFLSAGAPPPNLRVSVGWGQSPQIPPHLWISGYAPGCAFERRSPLEYGKKKSSSFGEDFFFGLHLNSGKKCSIFGEALFLVFT